MQALSKAANVKHIVLFLKKKRLLMYLSETERAHTSGGAGQREKQTPPSEQGAQRGFQSQDLGL